MTAANTSPHRSRPGPPSPFTHGATDQTHEQHTSRVRTWLALTILLGAVDVILIVAVWNVALNMDPALSWIMATVTAIGSAILAWTAGRWASIGTTDRHASHLVGAALAATAWIILAAAISYLRWRTGDLTGTAIRTEGTLTGETTSINKHHVLAIVLLGFWIMPGILAALHGWETGNPIAARQRNTHTKLARLEAQLRHEEAQAAEHDLLLAQHHTHKDRLDADAQSAHAQADELAAELKAYTRIRIAEAIGNPAGVETPHTHITHHNNTTPLTPDAAEEADEETAA